MKDSLLHSLIFLLLLLLCFVLFTAGYVVYLWDIQYVPSNPPTLSWARSVLPAAVKAVFVPAVVTAMFLVMIRIARRPGIALLSFLLPLVVSTAALYFGIILIGRLYGAPAPAQPRVYDPILTEHLNLLGTRAIYPTGRKGDALGPTLVVDPAAKPAFSFQPSGRFDPHTWSLLFPEGSLKMPVQPRNPEFSDEFAPRSFLVGAVSDVTKLSTFLEKAAKDSRRDFLIAVGGVTLFASACIGFAWATRWPLVNVFLVAVCYRGLFWLFALFSGKIATDAFALVIPKPFMGVAPSIGLGALGALVLLWSIFFVRPPARE